MDSLKSVLQSLSEDSRWKQDAASALKIRALIRSLLPRELAEGTSANLSEPGTLQISCHNALIATRVRNIVPSLQDKMKTVGLNVNNIQINVFPDSRLAGSGPRQKRAPTKAPEEVSAALEELAKKQKNQRFSQALTGLARRLRDL